MAAHRTAPERALRGTTQRGGAKGRRALLALEVSPVGKGVGLAEARGTEDIRLDAMA